MDPRRCLNALTGVVGAFGRTFLDIGLRVAWPCICAAMWNVDYAGVGKDLGLDDLQMGTNGGEARNYPRSDAMEPN